MSASLPPVTAAITTALRAFLLAVLPPDTPVLLARQNRMAAPNGPFVLMTVLLHQRIATSATRYTATSRIILQQQESTVQVSLFGQGAADNAQALSTLFQNGWAAEFFTALSENPSFLGSVTPGPASSFSCQPPPACLPVARSAASSAVPPACVMPASTPFAGTSAAQFSVPSSGQSAGQSASGPPPRIAPLYAGPARQIPFVNGERQYEEQWQIDLHLQASFVLTLPQPMASAARLVLADVTSPQGFPSA
ncbi:hypothetical protein AA0473_1706 [Acetobacter orleanensis NRIC 0473]|uniref:Phage neck terminator protein gp12-like domain-containing protein n=2 Tax=Acetobacter orleanensis TaxID=104099 RepID=A0A4Y3TJT0_9PROT|nr:hypothetical protein CO710_05850 [Acetobacter orleanensis]GAN69292.1 hypothetical protein Abol_030_057 [Acetobacter orleanensis JCM 7639]GBR28305.1 hypothetical protein AA0473_1706 [Acetobacter orleanensis NRIC 0473]GEB82182.1 hypothetical protein AOR01nite_06590 [Acetobacter orleanensis]